jgi:hypothetical protein
MIDDRKSRHGHNRSHGLLISLIALLFPFLGRREGDEDSIIGLPSKLLFKLLQEAKE